MIPITLEISNFLSYRQPVELDFSAIHLACISGANGSGKSSILDAITWSLFGKSRSRSDDDVVNRLAAAQGEEAEIRLTFLLEEVTYRVIRRKRVGRSVKLEFQVAGEEDSWKALTEGKVRETQAAIEDLLRMSFDTFINASFLLQGQADEFTTKTPNQRKEILADLLGVNSWDRYKEAAAGHRKEAEGELLLIDGRLGDIDEELGEQEKREAALEEARLRRQDLSETVELQEKLVEQLRRTAAAIDRQKELVQNLAGRAQQARQRLEQRQATLAQRRQERQAFQALLDEAAAISADYAAWQAAEEKLQSWQTRADQHNALLQAQRPHELALERERSRLKQRRQELQTQEKQIALFAEERSGLALKQEKSREKLAELAAALTELASQEKVWQEARQKLQEMEGERMLLKQELTQLEQRAGRVKQSLVEKEQVAKNLREAELALEEANKKLARLADNHRRFATATGELDTRRAEQPRLKERMDKLQERINRLEEESGGVCPLCGQELSDAHRQSVLAELKGDGKQLGDRYRGNKEQIKALTEETGRLNKSIQQNTHLERDQQSQQQRMAAAQARLEEIERLETEWQAAGQERLQTLQKQLADDAALQEQLALVKQLGQEAAGRETLSKKQQQEQQAASQTDARLQEIDRQLAHWEDDEKGLKQELAQVEQALQEESFAVQEQAALRQLATEIEELGYDEKAHQQARQAREQLAQATERYQALQQAQAAVKPLDETLADLEEQVKEQEETAQELAAEHEAAVAQLEGLSGGDEDLPAVEKELFSLREALIAADRQVGAAEQRLAVLLSLQEQREGQLKQRAQTSQRIQRLKVLERACGREGVQALLIEKSLPEIEDDANTLLERLTGGQMRVVFDTQRQLKSSDRLAETLDIHIVDSAGERPYENYSGGEKFRVNFAIRLALSKILAKRAGARLQTLVIDEGFGSQDPNGRQRLIEAINTIQDDFARILIITHIAELRDAFPTRIEVEKRGAGSVITII